MAIFTVHQPADSATTADAAEHMVFIRERMSFMALIFGPLWVLWQRLWLVFLLWVLVGIVIGIVGDRFGAFPATVLAGLFTLWFALTANDWRRWTLERRGWTLAGVVHAKNQEEAEKRFFERIAHGLGVRMAAASALLPPQPAAPPVVPGGGRLPPVVGFPEARV